MHAAPPVEVTIAPSASPEAWVAGLIAAASAVIAGWGAAWCENASTPGLRLAAAGLVAISLAASLVAAVARLRRRARRETSLLRWNGQEWSLVRAGDACDGHPRLMLDLGPWMLVRFLPRRDAGKLERAPAPAWLPLRQGAEAARWAALRGALWNGCRS